MLDDCNKVWTLRVHSPKNNGISPVRVYMYLSVYARVLIVCIRIYVRMYVRAYIYIYICFYFPIACMSRHVYVHCSHFSTRVANDHVIYLRNTLCAQPANPTNKQTNKPTNELTIYTDQSQEIRRILRNFKGHYCFHNSPLFYL